MDSSDKIVYNLINEFITKYNKPPNIEVLEIALQNSNTPES